MKKKYKIVSPVRFFIFILVSVLSMTMLIYSLLGFATTEADTSYTYRQVEVQKNDTLWSIANKYNGKDVDPRTTVNKICEINSISASDVQPGDTILVPVES